MHRSQIFHKTGKKKHFRHFLEKFDQKIALFLVKFFQKVPKNAFSCLFCEKFDCSANFFFKIGSLHRVFVLGSLSWESSENQIGQPINLVVNNLNYNSRHIWDLYSVVDCGLLLGGTRVHHDIPTGECDSDWSHVLPHLLLHPPTIHDYTLPDHCIQTHELTQPEKLQRQQTYQVF